jgi:hypothetical protein
MAPQHLPRLHLPRRAVATANARFLKTNFQRDWAYHYDRDADVHYFEMQEEPLGKYNRRQIDYCLDGKFML